MAAPRPPRFCLDPSCPGGGTELSSRAHFHCFLPSRLTLKALPRGLLGSDSSTKPSFPRLPAEEQRSPRLPAPRALPARPPARRREAKAGRTLGTALPDPDICLPKAAPRRRGAKWAPLSLPRAPRFGSDAGGSAPLLPPAPVGLTVTVWVRIRSLCSHPGTAAAFPGGNPLGNGARSRGYRAVALLRRQSCYYWAFDTRLFADEPRPFGSVLPASRRQSRRLSRGLHARRGLSGSPSPTLGTVPATEVVAFDFEL